MKKYWASLAITPMLSGCVGIAVGTYGTLESIQSASSAGPGSTTHINESHETPDRIELFGNCEVHIFTGGVSWAGVGAFLVVLPVPLAVPTGKYEQRVYIQNEQVVGTVSEYGEVTNAFGYMCGSNECSFVAGAVNRKETDSGPKQWCA